MVNGIEEADGVDIKVGKRQPLRKSSDASRVRGVGRARRELVTVVDAGGLEGY